MYDKSQLMRGTLEGCILQILSRETTYGYQIVTSLTEYGFEDIKEGTIYPLLVRLEKKNYISSTLRPSPLGPRRKYYRRRTYLSAWIYKLLESGAEISK